jgi:Transglycosylase SLT domain
MSRPIAWVAGAATALLLVCVLVLGGWLIMAAGASGPGMCGVTSLAGDVPVDLAALFTAAAQQYELGPRGPAVLAGLTDVESGFGQNLGPSSAGAVGWTQFMPSTWHRFGVDADGDGRRDPNSAPDAIFAAARYLRHLGAPGDWRKALFGYNHSRSYVDAVLARANSLSLGSVDPLDPIACGAGGPPGPPAGTRRIVGGGRLVPIPGAPGELVDERIAPDVEYLMRRYHVTVTAGYAPTGHAPRGEHPLGLAVDLQPAPDGTWDDVDALAAWAEPEPNHPRPPFRWVGYNGDANHGRGNHLHLSWSHGPAPSRRPPAPWVEVFVVGP